jgi:hypothetical protein
MEAVDAGTDDASDGRRTLDWPSRFTGSGVAVSDFEDGFYSRY